MDFARITKNRQQWKQRQRTYQAEQRPLCCHELKEKLVYGIKHIDGGASGKKPVLFQSIIFCDFSLWIQLQFFLFPFVQFFCNSLLSCVLLSSPLFFSPLLSSPLLSSPLLSSPLQADISLILGSHASHPLLQSSRGLINRHTVLMFYCLW